MECLHKHFGLSVLLSLLIIACWMLPSSSSSSASPKTQRFHFNVEWKKMSRLCNTKLLLTVNGEYPGPTIAVHEGDNIEIKVTNRVEENTTIHWHGIRQFRTGEWWNSDVDSVENEMMKYGAGPISSDAYTINGLPGPLYPCSNKDTFIQTVEFGKTYMLRIINAALNDELFFAIANHTLTVVEIDAVYTKPFTTTAIMIAPGQTTTVLMTANQVPDRSGMFAMAVRPYLTSVFPFNNSTSLGFLRYKKLGSGKIKSLNSLQVHNLPLMEDTAFATKFSDNLRSLASAHFPCNVPKSIDKRVIVTISLNLQDCPKNETCKGFNGKRFYASMNNQSFVQPPTSILESHYKNLTTGIFSSDFPEKPPNPFDYTGVDPLTENMNTEFGTKLLVVPYGTSIEIVLQDTSFLNVENHPIHVHGHNFFIVGRGFGNFDQAKHPVEYNLVDPPERNTVAVPSGGWAAIRIKADNPGVWDFDVTKLPMEGNRSR
ncbi:hypothetical protein QYF36_013083 [Acer negundo]|nr:hypothetical protein QYF36_013083 [Acer negundo]